MKIQAVRGMNDILPNEIHYWQNLERVLKQVVWQYDYQEIRTPLVENTELFQRTIGEATDIVEKEMYTFTDHHDHRKLSLRPEGTAGCVRALIEHGMDYHQTHKLWYTGPLFRHERPQKGRYRQFHQFGLEAFGFLGPDIDAELLMLSARIWRLLGIQDFVELELNSLGTSESRMQYKAILVDYFEKNHAVLDEDSKRRLKVNPLRILDSKNPEMADLIANAPKMAQYLDPDSREHFETLQSFLTAQNIPFRINPKLVRGLDYYNKTVFEWVTNQLGSQNAICAGGRYDGLVKNLGGHDIPAVGFALGIERVIELIKLKFANQEPAEKTSLFFVSANAETLTKAFYLAELVRSQFASLQVLVHTGGGSFKNQLKKADKSGAKLAVIIGEDELAKEQVMIKFLREEKPQLALAQSEFITWIQQFFS